MSILSIKGLCKIFNGIHAVQNLDVDIIEGAITALIGPNGSGKTTVFNTVTGFLPPDDGIISFRDENITNLTPCEISQLGIGRTFQKIRLFAQLSVIENVMLATKYGRAETLGAALLRPPYMKRREQENEETAAKYLELVGLLDKKEALGRELSHGQRKLLEIARALALESELLLLDEPMAGLYPETKEKMKEIIYKIRQQGKTILFIEHDISVVMDISDRIIVLHHGAKIAQGTPNEIRNNSRVRRVYLDKQ